ncbi:hypothetical protein PG994_009524 [Apiospora phragmitis]|uniref:PLD phosphodiesterase domain-containing protein n=1 Tax=Apiospora phragmitis TaxID=2905665 RepID=A0ABR1U6W1_9PEZI
MSATLQAFVAPWRYHLDHNGDSKFRDTRKTQFPDHGADADTLITASHVHSFHLGTGASIYTQSILPALLQARREIILVSCFWAQSDTLAALSDAIAQLAQERERLISSQSGAAIEPLRIRICFSSRSLLQKLFHPNSRDGFVYPPHTWPSQLGLPAAEALRAGAIDLQVKTLFFLPFSVMHPKFVVIDRQRAWLPSCNVSWEPWLEGCVEISGGAVSSLMRFYQNVWENSLPDLRDDGNASPSSPELAPSSWLTAIQSPASRFAPLSLESVPTVLLPSSHHQNPCFRPFPWMDDPKPPLTPLNAAVSCLLEMAQHSIYLQTPNLTSASVMDGILQALGRGIHVTIVTGKNMMFLEQIVTAGTTTSRCLKSLIRRYHNLDASASTLTPSPGDDTLTANPDMDLEAGRPRLGRLQIAYFRPDNDNRAGGVSEEPVQSHLKLTIVDEEYTVLGSGNMDRASWFTSQELGILFRSVQFANVVGSNVHDVLKTRTATLYESGRARDD